MINLDAPDPFALASWSANRLPTDPARMTWLMCAILNLLYGSFALETVEVSSKQHARVLN